MPVEVPWRSWCLYRACGLARAEGFRFYLQSPLQFLVLVNQFYGQDPITQILVNQKKEPQWRLQVGFELFFLQVLRKDPLSPEELGSEFGVDPEIPIYRPLLFKVYSLLKGYWVLWAVQGLRLRALRFGLGVSSTPRPHSSSFLWFIFRILL